MRVLHLITDLDTGGAEMMLFKLVRALPDMEHSVVSMLPPGPVGDMIRSLGVEVSDLGMRRGLPDPAVVWNLARRMRSFAPGVVQTWMYHANLLGLVSALLARTRPVVWNIRCSNMDLSRYGLSARLAVGLGRRLSSIPEAVVTNSATARDFHLGLGYRPKRFEVIPNGFDLEAFRPDPEARAALRAKLGFEDNDFVFGLVARVDPQKDHGSFIRAGADLAAGHPRARFLFAGLGTEAPDSRLAAMVGEAGIAGRSVLLGRRDDVPALMAALDAAVLCSAYGEGFPNTVGEAMACGTPCLVTDVGDSAAVAGPAGLVVPPGDPDALAEAMEKMISLPPERLRELGRLARARVEKMYSIQVVAAQYKELYRHVARRAC